MQENNQVKAKLKEIPHLPGIYKFFDENEILLYVGKAKDLKNRVGSYFSNPNQSYKTARLVSQIQNIEYTLVNSEYDALLLENGLIKNYQPKYNILLKDDKTYPFICITRERFPKITITRKPTVDKGTHYGPYTSLKAMYMVLELIKDLYPIRNCHLLLTKENIEHKKFKACLEYHIGNCKAPCIGLQSEEEYMQDIDQIHQILKGNSSLVSNLLKKQMHHFAQELAFEKAEELKQKLILMEKFQSKSLIVNPKVSNVDVFSILSDEKSAYINYLRIHEGSIIHTQNIEVKKKLDETDGEILSLVAFHLREEQKSNAAEIVSNILLNTEFENTKNIVPKIGDKKQLIDLSIKNVIYFKKEKIDNSIKAKKSEKKNEVLIEFQKILHLKNLPYRIECFDNSNIQGTNPVASMVCFIDGRSAKKEYRHYNIKTVVGPDDFASMEEIVSRRYTRLLEEKKELPDLIIVDGGKGQLSAACDALKKINIYGQIPIMGIAKRLEEIYLPEDEIPLHIHKKSPVLRLVQQIRDEAHRFAITFHRKKRSQNNLKTQLESIKGIGENTTIKLLKHFKSVKNIKLAATDEIIKLVGESKAQLVINSLKE